MATQSNNAGLLAATEGLRQLHSSMQLIRRDRQQIVIYEGDEVNKFYYVQSGYVKVYNINNDGEERTLILRRPGDIFPLLKDPAAPNYVSPYFYATMTDAVLGVIPQKDLMQEAEASREGAWALLRYVSDFSASLTDRLSQIENKSAEDKLEHLLPYLKNVCGRPIGKSGDYRLELKLTHQDLASLLGIARETVSREMQKLSRQGKIKSLDGHLIVCAKALE